jgi:hypothetical protein
MDNGFHAGKTSGRCGIEERLGVMRVNDVRIPAPEMSAQACNHHGPNARRFVHRDHGPPACFDLPRQSPACREGEEAQVESRSVRMAGELDEQFLQAPAVELEGDVRDA